MVWTNTCSADFYKEFRRHYGIDEVDYSQRVQRQASLSEFAVA